MNNEGAVWGEGIGHHGNSYAIPTKDWAIVSLHLSTIAVYVGQFIEYATQTPSSQYMVTQVGCGLAGFKDEEIAPLFKNAPENCMFDTAWEPWLGETVHYWGTFG